jgi:3-oxoacyl-[acyl-carrier protein] reductase
MEISLKNKNAFVCGSTQGIGKAAAMELAELGATVTLLARNENSLKEVLGELPTSESQQHDYITADFNEPELLKSKLDAYLKDGKKVHVLVNNSGGPPGGPIIEAETDEFLVAFKRHLVCNQILAQALVPGMKSERYGRIINIISTSVKVPIAGLGVSNTIRGAVASWAKTLAGELGGFGITVNNVLPGFTDTARLKSLFEKKAEKQGTTYDKILEGALSSIPAGRIGKPEETAAAIAFLASPAAAYINGVNVPVDGGRTGCL